MTTLEKLHKIEDKRCIYDIHYCKAGVGFVIYYSEKDSTEIWASNIQNNGLNCEKYYPTFEKAVEAEYKKL